MNSWFARWRRVLVAASFVVIAGSMPEAQGGYTTEKQPRLGMTFSRARDYEPIPVRPSEEWVVLYYAEVEAFREDDRKRFRPELRFVRIGRGLAPEPPPEPEATVVEEPGSEEEEEEEQEEEKPIVDWASYAEQKLSYFDLGKPEPGEERYGNRCATYRMVPKSRSSELRGWARTFDDDERTIAVFGICAVEDYEEQSEIWDTMLRRIKFYEPKADDLRKIERYYARRDYSLPEYRMRVRSRLVDGWEAEDTDNYLLVYSTKDAPLLRLIQKELEAIREEYVKLFPPAREITAVSTVRICKDEAEYRKYGGPPGTGGYWSVENEELVFYDYENVDGEKGTGKANSRIVLYHEAFHQYIYYAVGELAPHPWFNEGTGDYFSGALIKGGKVKKIDVNPWRVELIQAALNGHRRYEPVAFSEILEYTREKFYANGAVCYAQAWSMIYFLRTSKAVAENPAWRQIPDLYFETLKEEWAEQVAEAGLSVEDMEEEKLELLTAAVRHAALERAFSDVDLLELEDAWREFVLDL